MSKRVAILGMHRSGTSAIAKAVYELGFFMGDNLLPPSKTNKHGYYEDADIVDYNNKIIGFNWYKPRMTGSAEGERLLLSKLDNVFEPRGWWAIKDPRLCYTLPIVRSHYRDLMVITIYRNPWFAAHSLSARDDISFSHALDISLSYLGAMIKNTASMKKFRLTFDDLLLDTESVVISLATWLGVPFKQSAVDAVDASLVTWELRLAEKYTWKYHGGMAEPG